MPDLYYDIHMHSCLSPCGEDDMTPANIVGMAKLIGLDVIALTDHNSCRNCPSIMHYGKESGLLVIPGMELTTMEEVHVLCLFKTLKDAMNFDAYVYERLQKIPNNESIFGNQFLMNEKDEIVGTEPYLLINATNISFEYVYDIVADFHGIIIPAHLDKTTTSLLSNLGFIPEDSKFTCAEVKDLSKLKTLKEKNPYLEKCRVVSNSDAHGLSQMQEATNYITTQERSISSFLDALVSSVFY